MSSINHRQSERGGAGVKFLAVAVGLILLGYAGCNYVPVAYEGESFKQDMQTAVVQGSALPNSTNPVGAVKEKLLRVAKDDNIPKEAVIEVKQLNNVIQARVRYSRRVEILPFGIYTRSYDFDHTATPTGFMMKSN